MDAVDAADAVDVVVVIDAVDDGCGTIFSQCGEMGRIYTP